MHETELSRRCAALGQLREELREALASTHDRARESLERRIAAIDHELREVSLDLHNRSSMDAGSEA